MRLLPTKDPKGLKLSIRWLTSDGVVDYTASDLTHDIDQAKRMLTEAGIKARHKVGIRGENSYLWLVNDVALAELNAVSVVFPPEFIDRSNEDLINEYALSFMLLSDAETLEKSNHRSVATMGQIDPVHHQICAHASDRYPVQDDDHSFVFSSGTSGTFKGMVISKKGVLDQIQTFGQALDVSDRDRILLFMPFSSLQNRVLYYGAILRNVDMTAVSSTQLLEGLKRFQPSILIAPPIFYEAVEKSIKAALRNQSVITKSVLTLFTSVAKVLHSVGFNQLSASLLARVHPAAHDVFGGNMRIMVTGMAKISPSTLQFYGRLGLPLVQVYGLTECGVVCANTLTDNETGSVGKPLPGNLVSISDDGEIVVQKGAPQTSRFFHFEASTEDTRFQGDKIFTGDLGKISDSGTLTLVGRKKSTIVGHTGVKVQPELIEKRIEENDLVATAVLVGLAEGRSLGVVLRTTHDLNDDKKSDVEAEARSVVGDMATSFKNQVHLVFSPEDLTVDNGLLTRNLKINRSAVRKHFFSS